MGMGPKVTIPVLTYLFHRIEQRLDGRPTFIIIDEAWVVLANTTFGAKLEEWLRTFRKKNAAVVLATQSLSEIANSPYRDVILESCPTKLYLPNAEARNPQTRELYRKFGLSDRQIDIIAEAAPKRDYYYISPLGRRLFQFALGPAALAFIGAGSKEDVLAARQMIGEFGERWPVEWLRSRGLTEWADYLARHFPSGPAAAETVIASRGYLNGDEVHATGGVLGEEQGDETQSLFYLLRGGSAASSHGIAGICAVRRRNDDRLRPFDVRPPAETA